VQNTYKIQVMIHNLPKYKLPTYCSGSIHTLAQENGLSQALCETIKKIDSVNMQHYQDGCQSPGQLDSIERGHDHQRRTCVVGKAGSQPESSHQDTACLYNLNQLQTGDVMAQVVHILAIWELLQFPYTEDPPKHNLILQPRQLGQLEALQLLCLNHSVLPWHLDHDSKQRRTLGHMVVQGDLGVKDLLVNNFAVSNILDHHADQHHSEVLVQPNGHDHSLHLVNTAHTNYEQGIVCPIRGKKGCLHAFNMIQLQHSHPPQQGHQWTQFSKITMFYKTMHLPAQPCQEGLSHSEPIEFVLVPDTPTRTMLPPRGFSHKHRASG
jgi:hypothetical protein